MPMWSAQYRRGRVVASLRAFIERYFEEGQPAAFVGVTIEIFDRFRIAMIPEPLRKIVKSLRWCKIITGKVMEESGPLVPEKPLTSISAHLRHRLTELRRISSTMSTRADFSNGLTPETNWILVQLNTRDVESHFRWNGKTKEAFSLCQSPPREIV
jgi:hypothetical protein